MVPVYGLFEYYKQEAEKVKAANGPNFRSHSITRGELLRELDRGWPFGRF